jgi:hypothetical protein
MGPRAAVLLYLKDTIFSAIPDFALCILYTAAPNNPKITTPNGIIIKLDVYIAIIMIIITIHIAIIYVTFIFYKID